MDMKVGITIRFAAILVASLLTATACSPEVGSKEWCDAMKEKSKGDWTVNQATDFAKHCIL